MAIVTININKTVNFKQGNHLSSEITIWLWHILLHI